MCVFFFRQIGIDIFLYISHFSIDTYIVGTH